MVIIKTSPYANSLKPEFIKRVVSAGQVRTRSGYEYERYDCGWVGDAYHSYIIRKDPLTSDEEVMCRIEWRSRK